ncbi:hypothetical protein VTN02DRAFT_4780 [Thermoascus thermophilus]
MNMNTNSIQTGVKTRICMISDTHAYTPSAPHDRTTPYRHPLPAADVLLHAGDITTTGRREEHRRMADLLRAADAELKIVIAGNHDVTLDEACADAAEIRQLWAGAEARRAGIVYMDEGLRSFRLANGAQFTLYASPYTPERDDGDEGENKHRRWAFAYKRHLDRFNPSSPVAPVQAANPVPDYPAVDIMLTHGPPHGVLDRVLDRDHNDRSIGCEHLWRACIRARPRLHVFGHVHEASGAGRLDWAARTSARVPTDPEDILDKRCVYYDVSSDGREPLRVGEETLFVNASIVSRENLPRNAPWVVDMDLPPAEPGLAVA